MNKLARQAFTLIELLVVIAIIGILSGLIVISMGGMTDKASIAKAQIFSNSLKNALMTNIVAQYTFDDITDYNSTTKVMNSTAGNVPDSWSSKEGQAYGGPTFVSSDCISGSCLSFDGVNDYILIPNASSLIEGTGYNFSFWMNPHVFGYPSSPCGNKNAFLIQWGQVASSSGGILLSMDSPGGTSANFSLNGQLPYTDSNRWNTYFNAITKLNKWYFISVNYDPTTKKIGYFVDAAGPYRGSHSYAGYNPDYYPVEISSSPLLYLGGTNNNSSCGSGYFNGLLDDLRIYNAAMPTSQIKEQYYSGLNSLLANGNITNEEYRERINSIAINE